MKYHLPVSNRTRRSMDLVAWRNMQSQKLYNTVCLLKTVTLVLPVYCGMNECTLLEPFS